MILYFSTANEVQKYIETKIKYTGMLMSKYEVNKTRQNPNENEKPIYLRYFVENYVECSFVSTILNQCFKYVIFSILISFIGQMTSFIPHWSFRKVWLTPCFVTTLSFGCTA